MAEDVFGIVGSLQAAVFRVERVVAEGGFGVVYRAYHEGFRAAVALKCLKVPGTFSGEQRQVFLQKFREEGELLFRLSALIPSVVRPLHVGTLDSARHSFVPFIALEWLDGDSLDKLLERRRAAGKAPLDFARVARMMGPVARGLECAHEFPGPDGSRSSILHRDLKPENLLLSRLHGQEAMKILDFGIGKVRSAATQVVGHLSAEQTDLAAFTPAYGAPEQWLPKRYGQTGPWTDVWGFALCVVEALANRPPFEGDAPAVMAACIDERERPTPLSFGVRLPERAEAAFRKALAVDPRQRFHDIGEFWDQIEAASGVFTPRITNSRRFGDDSVLPPPDAANAVPSLAGSSRADGARPYPELTLGFEPPALARAAKPAFNDADDDEHVHLSVMPSNSLEQLEAPAPSRSSPRAAPPLAGSRRVARASSVRGLPSAAPTVSSVLARLLPALRLIALGIAIMIADSVYATYSGHAMTFGPGRALWIAGPLVGLGVVRLVLALAG